jgi:hypothetical protein
MRIINKKIQKNNSLLKQKQDPNIIQWFYSGVV